MPERTQEITELLINLSKGDQQAASKLIPIVYGELRRLARHYMRQERQDHTLQTTALVHEAYLRLIEQRQTNWQNRAHFFGIAAQLMRRILLDHARASHAGKRGGGEERLPLEEGLVFSTEKSVELIALDQALDRLAELSPRQSRIVELRFFGGLSVEETAEVMGIAPKTVKRDWSVARAWLHREVRQSG
ncbi:MAG TPA: sigma-70 family RNA polymerase sigma factor [Terriglobia bacterium]|nr:sigma-70 family RNA polymerase sigma factor [Terriglobia bacterium]